MDLETENRIAAILMKEAAELRRQAARDGIDAYLRPPNMRGRPNTRFLTATVVGVQQSNRAVEVNEMWRAREKEKEMDCRSKKDEKRDSRKNACIRFEGYERKHTSLCSSSKSVNDDGLGDDEIEEFLHSRAKRGRGTIGSRMDETGPYPYLPDSKQPIDDTGYRYTKSWRAKVGPEKPINLKSKSSSEDEESESESESGEERERERRTKRSKHHHHHHRKHNVSTDKKKKKRRGKERGRNGWSRVEGATGSGSFTRS